MSQVEALDASRTGALPFVELHRFAQVRAGFVSSNELKRVLKQHGVELSLQDMEALAAQVVAEDTAL